MSQLLESPLSASVMPRALFTAEEVADALVISETLVRQLTLDGELPCRRIGRLVRYTITDIEMFIASREQHRYRK
jgi:excisionase family DNA binding protein